MHSIYSLLGPKTVFKYENTFDDGPIPENAAQLIIPDIR